MKLATLEKSSPQKPRQTTMLALLPADDQGIELQPQLIHQGLPHDNTNMNILRTLERYDMVWKRVRISDLIGWRRYTHVERGSRLSPVLVAYVISIASMVWWSLVTWNA